MTAGDVAFSASQLLGPAGGIIGIAFAAGAAAGWNFAVRTVLKLTNERFNKLETDSRQEQERCNERIRTLEDRLHDMDRRYTSGLENQLTQVRQSTYDLFESGRLRRFDHGGEQSPQHPPERQP